MKSVFIFLILVIVALALILFCNRLRGKSLSYLSDPKNRQLQKQLLTLLRGDVSAAKRLLKHQRQLHPGKSDNWYLEKVIYDLQRDRRF
ncbi:hypothetical protein QUB80_10710 [Chlorogloeopsis sp. ULAP01]|uniref:hypothetical protein n=1 Tax=Chlorogloeopsis sp. ULAP01 TaxID=3056483 RepID=UPI0025AAF880|nr:hypothetical protein [Chlorogloeopsis sp. ULAP01]MDM9381174.1 hypothetical protein [Chlorogloeopsis sp. ULAP01]